MPIYTDDPGQGINQPIGNAPAGLGESLLSSLKQGFEGAGHVRLPLCAGRLAGE